ncbi:MAG TPA: metallophosphoesterase [Thermoplasmata archaeon]
MSATPDRTRSTGPDRSPEQILALDPSGADDLLDQLEADVPARPGLVHVGSTPFKEAVVFGDSHGDWRSTKAPVERFLESPDRVLIGLGDYIDRSPEDCGEGSVANALFLLGLVARYPERVFLVAGNHDLARRIPALPHDLPEEVDQLWGPDATRYLRLLGLLERGPLALTTESGVYLAHAGFPRGPPADWRDRFSNPSDETLIDLTWSDCAASRLDRGVATPFGEPELLRFLELAGCRVFLRGHDPNLTGRALYHQHLLTLHTTRHYERFGGVIFGRFPLDRPVASTEDVTVEHAPSERQHYPTP